MHIYSHSNRANWQYFLAARLLVMHATGVAALALCAAAATAQWQAKLCELAKAPKPLKAALTASAAWAAQS